MEGGEEGGSGGKPDIQGLAEVCLLVFGKVMIIQIGVHALLLEHLHVCLGAPLG